MDTPPDPSAMTDQELIEALATKVMGWTRRYDYWINEEFEFHGWNPTQNWNHTMEVVERAEIINLDIVGYDGRQLGWRCLLRMDEKLIETSYHSTKQLAICIAALKTVS